MAYNLLALFILSFATGRHVDVKLNRKIAGKNEFQTQTKLVSFACQFLNFGEMEMKWQNDGKYKKKKIVSE